MSSDARVLKTVFKLGGSEAEAHSSEKDKNCGVAWLADNPFRWTPNTAHLQLCVPGLHQAVPPS